MSSTAAAAIGRRRCPPSRTRQRTPRLLTAVAAAVLLLSLCADGVRAEEEPLSRSSAYDENSLHELRPAERLELADATLQAKQLHCGCPPRSLKAGSNLEALETKKCYFPIGTEAKYSCLSGHIKINGSEQLTCELRQEKAVWDNQPLHCEIVNCGDPGLVAHSTREGNSFTYNSHIHYRCNDGYTPDGTPFLRCNMDGKWNRKKPGCNRIQCPYLDKLDARVFVQYSDAERVVNSTVHFQCKTGFHVDNELHALRTCKWDGNWSGQNPNCVQNYCKFPGALQDGLMLLPRKERYLAGELIHYHCVTNNEYERVQCLPDGRLQGARPDCPRPPQTHCPPVEIEHGQFTSSAGDRFTLGAKLTFKCDYNFKLTEPKWIVCQHNGDWTGKTPVCVDQQQVTTSLILSYILTCIILIILLFLIISVVVLFRWRQTQIKRRQWNRYFCNYEYQQDKSCMPANSNQEMKLFFQSKRLSNPFTDL